MQMNKIEKNGIAVASVESAEPVMTDVQSALDLMMTAKYETGCTAIAINKEALAAEFFVLSSGLAGEILQKFINYGFRIAIYGDFSHYTSKPLKDFIYESNNGRGVFFQNSLDAAVEKLTAGR